jgi:hypothetical protein
VPPACRAVAVSHAYSLGDVPLARALQVGEALAAGVAIMSNAPGDHPFRRCVHCMTPACACSPAMTTSATAGGRTAMATCCSARCCWATARASTPMAT